jgi:amino acid adenylation domain-containing protein
LRYLLHQSIDEAADRDPDHEAIKFADQSLSYGELERRANGLARLLTDHGVTRGDRVGIYAEKCLELPVAIYGIMKAGAAYVPLDPSAPSARLQRIVADCGIEVVVTRETRRAALTSWVSDAPSVRATVGIAPGDDLALTCVPWDAVPPADAAPEVDTIEQDLAYVLYTSGSTAEPKGIMHTHRSALCFAEVAAATYGFTADDRLSNHAPLQFDLSTMDYFSAAVSGATTVIIPEPYTRVPASLSKLMAAERLTVFYAVPLAMIQLTLHGALDQRDLSALRWVLFGGEPFPTKHLRHMMSLLPHTRFSNVYGPTEVNGCTYHLVSPIDPESDEPIPIGRVYANAQALVVDGDDMEVPIDGTGELLIRSGTRMAGYWGRPEMTRQATYRRPAAGGGEDLFHRTGDLVQRLAGGTYKFLGRIDRQIKTRGHRVELDEIEVALLTHERIEEAAVYSVPDGEGSQKILAAVLLAGPSNELTPPSDLDAHLRAELPPYAVPSSIDVLGAFPRTTNGKIDRRLLRERALAGSSKGEAR